MSELYAPVTLANPLDGADSGTSHDLIRDDEGRWAYTAADLSSVVTQNCHGNSQYYGSENSGGVARRFTWLLLGVYVQTMALLFSLISLEIHREGTVLTYNVNEMLHFCKTIVVMLHW